ncbi:hypothetical protein BEP19_16690 [Ammoniphilus oxalaticus]|uniref:SMODS-associated and fused to various effectors domain-containing protein n=1 Tax=Ammoniphilus oxalaticus TaxID=66863 RepID=A0A419SQ53_9BACL|nr:SAVED domain-containing protein [Ammoniphilus oxalaticus]RKD26475.1 hypothetical protein BEP19_16690 [Ammoniphilus oxalaticus]
MSRYTSAADKFVLWANSGGICAFRGCNEKLLYQVDGINVNLSNAAHIIGHSSKGPRAEYKAEYKITEFNVDNEPNLMLTCYDHHKIIDDSRIRGKYPPELLFEMKKEHEEWVQRRVETNSKSIALIHKTKGEPLDEIILSEELNNLLIANIQYQEELMDFTDEGWLEAKKKNKELYAKFKETARHWPGAKIEMFPLSHIPLLIHIGSLITDTNPVTIYQYDRMSMKWVFDSPEAPHVEDLGLTVNRNECSSNQLVVTIGLSGIVHTRDVEAVIPPKKYDSMEIKINNPRPDRVLYREHVSSILSLFREEIYDMITKNGYSEVHLFYAGPAGLAVEIGRCINKSMWPDVYIYNYDNRKNPKYQMAITI